MLVAIIPWKRRLENYIVCVKNLKRQGCSIINYGNIGSLWEDANRNASKY